MSSTESLSAQYTILWPDVVAADIDACIKDSVRNGIRGVVVPPFWVKRAAREISGQPLRLGTVAGYPLGFQMTETKQLEISKAIDDGVQEVYLSMNTSAFKSKMPWVKIEFAKCAKMAHEREVLVYVVMDGELLERYEWEAASKLAADAGADGVVIHFKRSSANESMMQIQKFRSAISPNLELKVWGHTELQGETIQPSFNGIDEVGIPYPVGDDSEDYKIS